MRSLRSRHSQEPGELQSRAGGATSGAWGATVKNGISGYILLWLILSVLSEIWEGGGSEDCGVGIAESGDGQFYCVAVKMQD